MNQDEFRDAQLYSQRNVKLFIVCFAIRTLLFSNVSFVTDDVRVTQVDLENKIANNGSCQDVPYYTNIQNVFHINNNNDNNWERSVSVNNALFFGETVYRNRFKIRFSRASQIPRIEIIIINIFFSCILQFLTD